MALFQIYLLFQTKTCSLVLMQETPLVCPLFNIVPKAASIIPNVDGGNEALVESKSAGILSFGYMFLLLVVILAFVAFFLVLRNPERREIVRNIFRRRNTSHVQYSRVSVLYRILKSLNILSILMHLSFLCLFLHYIFFINLF